MTEPIGETSSAGTDMIGVADDGAHGAPLTGGVVGPEGLPELDGVGVADSGGRKQVLTQGTMLILIVFVISAGTLYGMRLSQRETGVSASTRNAEAQIDKALQKLASRGNTTSNSSDDLNQLDKLFQDTKSIRDIFNNDPTERQVPAEYVKKNPFVLPDYRPVEAPIKDPEEEKNKARTKLLAGLNRELNRLVLQSIMQGPRPVAIISGQMVQPGQDIGSFTVNTIHDLWVELTSEGESFSLRMPNPAEGNSEFSPDLRR